ncbi:MAG: VOC family protein [Nitriliruptorales bacterium]
MAQESLHIGRSGFVWHELMSSDPTQSERFYQQVAGLTVTPLGDGPDTYLMLMAAGQPVGGIAGPRPHQEGWPSGGPEAHWIGYLATDDVDAAARTAEELGGAVLLPPVDIPGMGRAAVLRDPQGAAFGIFAPQASDEPSPDHGVKGQ